MSRAIPSNFSEYLLDQTSRNTGIVCDGGIMPLRTNPDPYSLWYKNCLRGEDVMFLKEAVAARRDDSTNSGLDDTSFKASRLNLLKLQIGLMFDSGTWTDTDPRRALAMHVMQPGESAVSYIKSKLNPIAQASASDTYATLDHVPIEHLFGDIKSLSYGLTTSGWDRTITHQYTVHDVLHYNDGRPARDNTYTQTGNSYMWYSTCSEQYQTGYPDGLRSLYSCTPYTCSVKFTESSGTRRFHRYLEAIPYGVFKVTNDFQAGTAPGGVSTLTDNWTVTKEVFHLYPWPSFTDMLNSGNLTFNNQTVWRSWAAAIFDAAGLQMNAEDIQGKYDPTDPNRWRSANATITPTSDVWVFHMLYCSLDAVTI